MRLKKNSHRTFQGYRKYDEQVQSRWRLSSLLWILECARSNLLIKFRASLLAGIPPAKKQRKKIGAVSIFLPQEDTKDAYFERLVGHMPRITDWAPFLILPLSITCIIVRAYWHTQLFFITLYTSVNKYISCATLIFVIVLFHSIKQLVKASTWIVMSWALSIDCMSTNTTMRY